MIMSLFFHEKGALSKMLRKFYLIKLLVKEVIHHTLVDHRYMNLALNFS